jgi:hypothetical protein
MHANCVNRNPRTCPQENSADTHPLYIIDVLTRPPQERHDSAPAPIPKRQELKVTLSKELGFGTTKIRQPDLPLQRHGSPQLVNKIQVIAKADYGLLDVKELAPQKAQPKGRIVNGVVVLAEGTIFLKPAHLALALFIVAATIALVCCCYVKEFRPGLLALQENSVVGGFELLGDNVALFEHDLEIVEGFCHGFRCLLDRHAPDPVDFFVDGIPVLEGCLVHGPRQYFVRFDRNLLVEQHCTAGCCFVASGGAANATDNGVVHFRWRYKNDAALGLYCVGRMTKNKNDAFRPGSTSSEICFFALLFASDF